MERLISGGGGGVRGWGMGLVTIVKKRRKINLLYLVLLALYFMLWDPTLTLLRITKLILFLFFTTRQDNAAILFVLFLFLYKTLRNAVLASAHCSDLGIPLQAPRPVKFRRLGRVNSVNKMTDTRL